MQSEALLSTTLGAICEQQGGTIQTGPFGSQLHASDYAASGTPVVMPADIVGGRVSTAAIARVGVEHVERLSQHQLRFNDIVFSRRGDVTRFARVTEREVGWLCGTGCLKVRMGTGTIALPEWISIALAAPEVKDWLVRHAVGATMPNLNTSILGAVPLRVPPIEQQREAVEVCFALDDRIDLLRQTNVALESIAQALSKSWFIDFDPVRAKAEGREPEGMDAATAALFPAELEESAMGLIPRGWRVAAIKDVVADVYDGPHATPPEASGGAVFLGIKNLTGTSLDLGQVRHISEDDWAQWTRRVTPQPDDIVFSYEAALGLFALIPPGLRCCLGRRLALVRPRAEDGTPHFWFHQFVGEPFQRLLDKHTVHGATVNRIALKEFPLFTVVDPGHRLRTKFEADVQPLWARIHANRTQALKLAEIRDSLLPQLISGKLRLPEARAQLEDAIA